MPALQHFGATNNLLHTCANTTHTSFVCVCVRVALQISCVAYIIPTFFRIFACNLCFPLINWYIERNKNFIKKSLCGSNCSCNMAICFMNVINSNTALHLILSHKHRTRMWQVHPTYLCYASITATAHCPPSTAFYIAPWSSPFGQLSDCSARWGVARYWQPCGLQIDSWRLFGFWGSQVAPYLYVNSHTHS